MTDRENFLERWSRRKRTAAESSDAPKPRPVQQSTDAAPAAAPAVSAKRGEAEAPASQSAAPEFDLTKLPPLDSITSATDVRVFLTPGVPQHLTRAALRRAWTADPAIRDFVGLQDYDWDFVTPGAIPGFSDLPANYDVREMLSQVLGDQNDPSDVAQRADEVSPQARTDIAPTGPQHLINADELPSQMPDIAARHEDERGDTVAVDDDHQVEPKFIPRNIVQREDITAPQHGGAEDMPEKSMPPRKHGGALPK
jgi:hypothetical protein